MSYQFATMALTCVAVIMAIAAPATADEVAHPAAVTVTPVPRAQAQVVRLTGTNDHLTTSANPARISRSAGTAGVSRQVSPATLPGSRLAPFTNSLPTAAPEVTQ